MIVLLNEIITEGLGIFILFLIIFSNIKKTYIPIIIAIVLFLILYFTIGTSKGHYNSTISFAKYIEGDLSLNQFLGYNIGQIFGSLGAIYIRAIMI